MLIPNQYTLAEANQLVPLLENSLQEIGASLVEMHRAKLSMRIRQRVRDEYETLPAAPLRDDVPEADADMHDFETSALHDGDVSHERANARPSAQLGRQPGRRARREWPVGIALEHIISPPEEVAHAILEAVEEEAALARRRAVADGNRPLRAWLHADDEMNDAEEDAKIVADAEQKIRRELDVLQRMGVFVHSMEPPTVHLLSRRGASPVLLSWRPGEPEFMHWHSLDWGFEERAPIDDPALFGGNVLPC